MITLKEASLSYKRNNPVLDRVDLDIQPGCIYGLLGKNGEGKTTLLNILSGQLFLNKGISQNPAERSAGLLQKLFLLPEEINMPDVTAMQYIRMYAPFYPTFSDDILKACFESFEVDFSARLNKMSQGQRKKVAITLALAVHTPLLLMDEPTNGLDIPSKDVFRKLLASFTNEQQTVIISTHQVRDLESLIDAVLILDNKKVILNSPLNEIGRKLFFRLVSPEETVLYQNQTPFGLMGVGENTKGEETPVSLELLFNAATLHPEKIKNMFN
jgi:ABC-2 type transport system ATP-binding protein